MNTLFRQTLLTLSCAVVLAGCGQSAPPSPPGIETPDYYGTLTPFASEAVYFVVTDRFVNGDPENDQRDQGGEHPTFDIPLPACADDGVQANIGYLGGDFKGLLDNADYIREMGFTAVWITPIVDNPDQAFTGGDEITCTSFLTDRGKSGYHGYWGLNFFAVDEHLPSPGLGFAELTRGLQAKGLKTVLDIVGNHSSPGYTMTETQPGFGQLLSADGSVLADHQNLPPEQLDPANNPLHAWYNTKPDLAQLADLNADHPAVLDYLVDANLQWIEQGAHAFRVDTIRHQPYAFWKAFADRIRARHPDFFMFGEAFNYDAATIAPFTWPENGSYSLLDFPLKKAVQDVFENDGDFAQIGAAFGLDASPFQNPYELTTFYDNHDMPRIKTSDAGFIDAHNLLFTARGIPVIYYGSEMGFMRGKAEHAGNRNYFGSEGIEQAREHPIRSALGRIAHLRGQSIALQRGLQLNLEFKGDLAAFLRVYQYQGTSQTALVVLNKGDQALSYALTADLQAIAWREGFSGESLNVSTSVEVPAHGVAVWLSDSPISAPTLRAQLDTLMARNVMR
ncbi:alpha-amylase family glycosyl hydrolase [Pseudomarimonas arenosa]|uniref:Cyclomaltodextrin glucanotransferase n=1 Tax=Pseudomarimonas arenosa TaxID=2774145 RepID=A0AAW3ZT55_9GAMM|nr:alpha-amylase family glycosyl hydrolase [Pseudomarimonas arenosa]MBD8527361.1 cyclomaltodextrin glucanotransferase [Pseudomarimonas arenosa]